MKILAPTLFLSILFLIQGCSSGQTSTRNSSVDPQDLLQAVNKIRSKGCKCGGTYMPPVKPLRWNNKLEKAANTHSVYMNNRKRLSHTGSKNSNPGTRILSAGYKWSFYAGYSGKLKVSRVYDIFVDVDLLLLHYFDVPGSDLTLSFAF